MNGNGYATTEGADGIRDSLAQLWSAMRNLITAFDALVRVVNGLQDDGARQRREDQTLELRLLDLDRRIERLESGGDE